MPHFPSPPPPAPTSPPAPAPTSLPLRHSTTHAREEHRAQRLRDEQNTEEHRQMMGDSDSTVESPRTRRLRVQTRRRRYLELHSEYFDAAERELADPLLYDRLVRRWQSASQREAAGRARGVAGGLEVSLVRGEAKLSALQPSNPSTSSTLPSTSIPIPALESDDEEEAHSLAEGTEKWRKIMGKRFLRGEDGEVDYGVVDEGEEFDDLDAEGREEQEGWFEEEREEFIGGLGGGGVRGETGVQDF